MTYIKCGDDFSIFSNYKSHICIFSSEKEHNVDESVNTDERIHLFLSRFVRFNTEPVRLVVKRVKKKQLYLLQVIENINSKDLPVVSFIYNMSENKIKLDLKHINAIETQNHTPTSTIMTNGHTLEWDVKNDIFNCVAQWKSVYELWTFPPLGVFLYKHVLRNPQSALQPNLHRNCQNKTLLNVGTCTIGSGPQTTSFLGSEINPEIDNLEQIQNEQNTGWIVDPHWIE